MVMTKAPGTQMQVIDGDHDDYDLTVTSASIEIAQSRETQEVQAQMTIAKRFPRDETQAYARVIRACKRRGLAEASQYEYSRGGSKITGPSIRLAEQLARSWGNLNFGLVELDRKRGASTVMAFAWDLETNTRQTKTFVVRHERHTRDGVTILTDERDIYELIANNGARRMRNCILGVIPVDIVDDAIEQCNKTLAAASGGIPLTDRVRKLAVWFGDRGVTIAHIEARLGHAIDATTETECAALQKLSTAIHDKATTVEEAFKNARADVAAKADPQPAAAPKKTRVQEMKEAMNKPEVAPPVVGDDDDAPEFADDDPPPPETSKPAREPGSDDD